MTRLRALAWSAFAVMGAAGACEDGAATPTPPSPSSASPLCEPGALRPCYDGPAGTEGVGECEGGEQTCDALGRAWGPCVGARLPEPESCATDADENCDGLTTCGETLFSWRFGGERDETVTRIDVGPDGAIYLQGHYRDPIELGGQTLATTNGTRDVFVLALDTDGEVAWVRTFHGPSHLSPRGLAVAADGRVGVAIGARGEVTTEGADPLGGESDDDVVVAVFDGEGSLSWWQRFGDDEGQRPEEVAFLPDGALVVVGGAAGIIDFGDGPQTSLDAEADVFVAVFEADGIPRWTRLVAGIDQQRARAVAVHDDGRIAVVGEAWGQVDFGGGPLTSAGDADAFVWVMSADGEHHFSHRWGDGAFDRAHDVAFDAEGAVMLVGRFEGELPVGPDLHASSGGAAFGVKLSAEGDRLWSHAWGGANGGAYGVAFDSLGRAVVSGFYEDVLAFGQSALPPGGLLEPQIMVLKLEPDGSPVWGRGWSVKGDQTSSDAFRAWRVVDVDAEDRIFVAGFVEGAIDFGDDVAHDEPGGADAFVLTLAP